MIIVLLVGNLLMGDLFEYWVYFVFVLFLLIGVVFWVFME